MKKNIYLLSFLILINCKSNDSDFKLCQGSLHPYYYPELEYKGGFYEIKKYFYSEYEQIEDGRNTGIVRIRFNINCNGESGNYEVETCNLDYKNKKMNKKIIKQLLKLTKNLTNWIPAKNEDGAFINSHKFFAFKIVNGKLEDVLPK